MSVSLPVKTLPSWLYTRCPSIKLTQNQVHYSSPQYSTVRFSTVQLQYSKVAVQYLTLQYIKEHDSVQYDTLQRGTLILKYSRGSTLHKISVQYNDS